MKNRNNFYSNTNCQWTICNLTYSELCLIVKLEDRHISKSGSEYFFVLNGVYRVSAHWGTISSCYWTLPQKTEGIIIASATWEQFTDAPVIKLNGKHIKNIKYDDFLYFGKDIKGWEYVMKHIIVLFVFNKVEIHINLSKLIKGTASRNINGTVYSVDKSLVCLKRITKQYTSECTTT